MDLEYYLKLLLTTVCFCLLVLLTMFCCFCICILCLDFFNGYCIFSGQPFPAGFDLIFISGCACSKLSAVVEIKPLHIICRNVLYILIHHSHTPDGLSAQPCHCAGVQASCAEVVFWSGVTCTYSSYVFVGVYCVTTRKKKLWGKKPKQQKSSLTSKVPVQ